MNQFPVQYKYKPFIPSIKKVYCIRISTACICGVRLGND